MYLIGSFDTYIMVTTLSCAIRITLFFVGGSKIFVFVPSGADLFLKHGSKTFSLDCPKHF